MVVDVRRKSEETRNRGIWQELSFGGVEDSQDFGFLIFPALHAMGNGRIVVDGITWIEDIGVITKGYLHFTF